MITETQRPQRKETKKPHLSHTQLEMYWRCPEQYRRRYIEKEILPPGIALMEGRAIHSGAEHNFRQKIASYKDVPVDEIVEATMSAFEKEIAGGYILDADEAARGPSVVIGEAKDMTRQLANLHATQQAPAYQPVAIERETLIVFGRATHDLLTVTDLIDDQNRVTDIKTAKKAMNQGAVESSTQLTIYSAARYAETRTLPTEVRFDNLIKNKVVKRQVLTSHRTMADLQVLANRINVTLAAINSGMFPPCPAGSWGCNPKWCGYFMAGCPYVNSERRTAAEQGD